MARTQSINVPQKGIFSFTDDSIISLTLSPVQHMLLIMGELLYQADKDKQLLNLKQGSAGCNDHKRVFRHQVGPLDR